MSDLTDNEIRALKQEFGPLFAVPVNGVRYICRSITRTEAAIVGYLDDDNLPPEKLEALFRISVLWPEDASDDETLELGTISAVVAVVLDKSGLTTLESLQAHLVNAKERRTIYDEIGDIICAAFPTLEPNSLNSLTVDVLMDYLVHAENVLIIKGLSNRGLMSEVDFTEKKQEGTVTFEGDELAKQLREGADKAAAQYLMTE